MLSGHSTSRKSPPLARNLSLKTLPWLWTSVLRSPTMSRQKASAARTVTHARLETTLGRARLLLDATMLALLLQEVIAWAMAVKCTCAVAAATIGVVAQSEGEGELERGE